jgi:hypothetical protein
VTNVVILGARSGVVKGSGRLTPSGARAEQTGEADRSRRRRAHAPHPPPPIKQDRNRVELVGRPPLELRRDDPVPQHDGISAISREHRL